MADQVPASLSCEVLILTALPVEYQAVLAHLQDVQEITHPKGTVYEWGIFTSQNRTWRVVIAEIGMGGPMAASETERAISFFHAQIALFVGVAGGVKNVKLGDVIASTKVYTYEAGKAAKKFEVRPVVWPSSYALEQRARSVARKDEWLARLDDTPHHLTPHAYIGALAAGEKVLGSTQSSLYTLLKANYGDSLAVEMEGHGFLAAIHANHTVHGLVIRGISDLIDNKPATDAAGWQERAARHAAAFAFQVLTTFTLPTSDSPSSPPADPVVWNVPHLRNLHFTGRDELLNRLDRQLSSETQDDLATMRRAALTQPQAIKGLGGIGKTQIAVEYAYRSRDLDRYTYTFWINAANEEALLTSFIALAELLPAFPAKGETNQWELVKAVKRWLEQCQQRWLLIFDNADDVTLVRDYLPQRGNGSVLLTTRADAVGSLAVSVEVETMGFVEGTHLLLRRAQRFEHASEEEINQAGNIVVALDHFPLALDQAGAYIEETQCSFDEYLRLYATHSQTLLAQRGNQATGYPDSVATTWLLSFQKVQQANPAAAELLHLCSFLAPDRIPEELFRGGVAHWPPLLQKATADLLTFRQMIADLLKFSLVKCLVEDHTLSIHRLVQAVQRDRMEVDTQRRWAERAIRAINAVFPDHPTNTATWPQCLRYLDQAQACHVLIERYGLAFIEAATILNRTSIYLNERSLYAITEPLLKCALLIYEQQLGTDHPDTASCLSNLAALYCELGRYSAAEPLYLRVLRIREQQLGVEHPDTASCLNNLALLYRVQGRYSAAEPLYLRALRIREQQLGAEHPDTAQSLNTLALLYQAQGQYSAAEPLHLRALRIREQQLGAEHPDTAQSLNNLALLYQAQGQYSAAEPLYKRALRIREQQLGAEHLYTAQSLNNLAELYRVQGQYNAAEPLYKRALLIYEQLVGAEHPNTASILNNLALLYQAQGQYNAAEPLYKRALLIYGAERPNTASILNNLAELYRVQGQYNAAEPLYKRALLIYEQLVGAEHPDTVTILNNLALLYQAQGQYSAAEPLHLRALHIREQQLGAEHPDTAQSLNNLALLYQAQGQYSAAEPLYKRALLTYKQLLGAEQSRTQIVLKTYICLLRKLERAAEAKQLEEGF